MQESALGFIVLSPSFSEQTLTEPSLAIAAARAGDIGIIDAEAVSNADLIGRAFSKLQEHSGQSATIGVRLEIERVDVLDRLAARSDQNLVVILTAGKNSLSSDLLKSAVAKAKAHGFAVFCEVISAKEAHMAESAGVSAVIAKGHESAGRVGDTTSFVLMQQCVRELSVPVWVQGGIGLHTVAAVAACGAAGAVLDSQLYLCRDSQVAPELKLRIERMDGTETSLRTTEDGQTYRVIAGGAEGSEVLPVGQDACMARVLSNTGGTVCGALDALRDAVTESLEVARRIPVLSENSALAKSHNTKYPIVQGAMTRVSDTSEFAFQVADGGALPFLALSLMRGADIEKLLTETKQQLGERPWGVGLLGFVPQQLREEQWEAVNRHKPPFALIAGGRPDQAKALEDAGTKTYLHVPSPLLLKSFIEMGSKRFIFEGKECGGHVGPRSSMVLWDSMIQVLLESIGPRDDASAIHVLFAGGIHDDLSAAMVAALAAPLAARGVKVGVLLGTAYLFTKEAVESGAIVQKFQDEALKCDETVLLETGPGHSIRCIASPYKQAFDQHRQNLEGQSKGRDEIREELEMMNLGRLRIASKGLARGTNSNELVDLPAEQQWQQGMYMIGQVAAMHNELTTIEKLHANVSAGGQRILDGLEKRFGSMPKVEATRHSEPIAIVGMSCMFPQANDVETYWQNILNKVDSIDLIPETHFNWKNYYDADPLAKDKIVSKWGGFLQDIVFDPSRYGIPPSSLESIDPMQVLILEAARTALNDAGYTDRKYPRDKTSVILANAGHGPITALYSLRSMLGWKLEHLDEAVKRSLANELPGWTEDSFAGYLGNVTAGRVANRFDLKGINFSIDAACASSLAALYVAVNDLRSRASDVVLLGATDTHNQPGDFLSFSKTHALSPQGRCKTFDASADGIVISEGIAMVVLKRLADAERDGDRIYAVIRGMGGSSDGRDLSLTAPRPAGQMLALERAYEDAGIQPSTIGLVEAHGTGTVAGDKAEVEALTNVFQLNGAATESCAIGSVKTNIGHTKAAAGLASLVKIAKSLYHKVIPPTINVNTPNPACKFGEGPFYLSTETRPWINANSTHARRAGVSAFGFGGTNFHTVLEEYVPPCDIQKPPTMVAWPAELFVWKARSLDQLLKLVAQTEGAAKAAKSATQEATTATKLEQSKLFELAAKLQLKSAEDTSATAALAIVATSLDSLAEKIKDARQQIEKEPTKSFSNAGAHFSPTIKPSPVAFLFPGQGSQRVSMLQELSLYFPEISSSVEQFDRVSTKEFGQPLSEFIYPVPALTEEKRKNQQLRLTATQVAQPALGACDVAIHKTLTSLGITPNMVAGHSYGEYVALYAAGSISEDALVRLSVERGRILADCAAQRPGAMAAISTDLGTVAAIIKDVKGVYIANVNSPSQCIISGDTQAIDAVLQQCKTQNIAYAKIPVSAAFHTPLMDASKEPLRQALTSTEFSAPKVPVWSNTTAEPLLANEQFIRDNLSDHALKPVLFSRQLESMHDAGARVFIEVGPGNVLTGLAQATLKGREFVAVSMEASKQGLVHFLNSVAVLVVNGVAVDLRQFFWNRYDSFNLQNEATTGKKPQLLYRVNSIKMERIGTSAKGTQPAAMTTKPENNGKPQPKKTEVATPIPTISQATAPAPLPAAPQRPTSGGSVERVMLDFQQSMLQMTNRFLETQQTVMLAYLQSNGKAAPLAQQQQVQQQPLPVQQPMQVPMQQQPQMPQIEQQIPQAEQQQEIQIEDEKQDSALPIDSLIESLYEIVSDRTGYPRDMLDPSLDMEADLGIDSIKRVEILNNFRKLLPEAIQEQLESGIEQLAGTKTLQGVIDWISSLEITDDIQTNTISTNTLAVSSSNNGNSATAVGNVDKVARGVVAIKQLPTAGLTTKAIAKNVLIAVGKNAEAASALAEALERKGCTTTVLSKPVATLTSSEQGAFGIVIHFGDRGINEYFALAKHLESDLKGQSTVEHRAAVINITYLGGKFATDANQQIALENLTQQAATVGFSKTLAKEWPSIHVKTIDFAIDATANVVTENVLRELYAADDTVEICYVDGARCGLDVIPAQFATAPKANLPTLSPSSVVLVTGGARGITAEIVLDLARKYRPTFVIVGRSPRPSEQEDSSTASLSSAKDIKAALIERERSRGNSVNIRDIEKAFQSLLKEREIRKTLAELQACGSKVKYYAVDVADQVAFANFIDTLYETADVDGVIHGAGIIEDALIKDKTAESFDRVFRTKVDSALTLANKLRFDTLKFLFLFSSVVGRTGNAGQGDYVAANEALNKLAVALAPRAKGRVASLMWGPWQAGMAPPELEEVFAQHGWSMIQPQDGRLCFHEELLLDVPAQSEVLLVGKLATIDSSVKPSGALIHNSRVTSSEPVSFGVSINTPQHLYLDDHKFDGIPVMPMAVALEMMLEAGQSLFPERQLVSVSNLDIPAGIVFHSSRKDLILSAVSDPQHPGKVTLSLNGAGVPQKPHFRCKAEFAEAPPAMPNRVYISALSNQIPTRLDVAEVSRSTDTVPDPRKIYGTWLFHGPIFQGMSSIISMTPSGICGEVTGCRPERFVTFADGSDWIIDPVLLDSALQLAGVWARNYKDVTVLPAGFKGMRVFRSIGSSKVTARVFLSEALATELLCDLGIYDEDGQLAIVIEGLGGIASKAFNRFSAQSPVQELV